jgi:hypothetical protein
LIGDSEINSLTKRKDEQTEKFNKFQDRKGKKSYTTPANLRRSQRGGRQRLRNMMIFNNFSVSWFSFNNTKMV